MDTWSVYAILSFFPIFGHLNLINNNFEWITESKKKTDHIQNKIDKMAQNIITNPSSEKVNLLNNLKERLEKAAKHLGPKGKKHVELIMKGIKLKVFEAKNAAQSIIEFNNSTDDYTHINENQLTDRKIVEDLTEKIILLISIELEKIQTTQSKNDFLNNIKNKVLDSVSDRILEINKNNSEESVKNNTSDEVNKQKNNITELNDEVHNNLGSNEMYKYESRKRLKSVTTSPACSDVYDRTCLELKNMNSLKCLYDDTTLPLETLCNGVYDCPDRSDEKYCGSQAMERLRYSNWVMTNIDTYLSNKCFDIDESQSIISKRTQIIRDVIQAQEDFREKYKSINFSYHSNNNFPESEADIKENLEREAYIKAKANEIVIVISSLALTLDGALCSDKPVDFESRRHLEIIDKSVDVILDESFWPPVDCNCVKGSCINCSSACKRTCWQKNSLSNWNCDSVNGSDTVSLNLLCDGNLDCFDESDEKDCVKGLNYAKFEAHRIYNNVVQMVNIKIPKVRLTIQKKLILIRNLIVELQKLTIKEFTNSLDIRETRNKCYSFLQTIYSEILEQSVTASESEEAYVFLLAINQYLGAALKRSDTGNKRIIAEGCICRNGSCAVAFCSKVCLRACVVEPKLMRYRCKHSNSSVTLNDICNGKKNCPDGSDEMNCKKEEVCRRHHLFVLRNNLQEVGNNLIGTSLGELLTSWKTKVISSIKVAEHNGRPTPGSLKEMVKNILNDLLVTYGSVEDYRRSKTGYSLPLFMNIARVIMETVKTCGQ